MLEAFGLSDPGCVRSNNEDYFISDSESGIFILADGMGGANAGEYASRLSAETLYEYLVEPGQSGRSGSARARVPSGELRPFVRPPAAIPISKAWARLWWSHALREI